MDRLPLLAAAALGSVILAASHVQAIAADAGAPVRVAGLSLGETLSAAIAAGAANSYSQDAPPAAPAPVATPPQPVVSVPPPLVMPPAQAEIPVAVRPTADAGTEPPRASTNSRPAIATKHHRPAAQTARRAPHEKANRIAATPTPRPPAPEAEAKAVAASEPTLAAPPPARPATPDRVPAPVASPSRHVAAAAPGPSRVTAAAPKPPHMAAPAPAKAQSVIAEPAMPTATAAAAPIRSTLIEPAKLGGGGVTAVTPMAIDTLPSPPEDVEPLAAVGTPATAPATKPKRVAALESGLPGRPHGEPALTLSFTPGSAALNQQSRDTLQQFGRSFAAHPGRLEIASYANSGDGSAAGARRLSLKRALAVREVLLGQGVAATRMDVRALGGSGGGSGDPNRLELTVEDASGAAPAKRRSGGG